MPGADDKTTPSSRWRGVSYIASTKGALLRCVEENKCRPDKKGQVNLNALPVTFQDFISANKKTDALVGRTGHLVDRKDCKTAISLSQG